MLGEKEIQKRMHWQCPSARFFGGYFAGDPERGGLPIGDGGRWVCRPDLIREAAERGECLIYSIGSDGEFSFERSIHKELSDKCEIHTFDANPIEYYTSGKYNPGFPHTRNPDFVNYHVTRLTPKNNLAELVRMLGHEGRTIHILKIDCEGCEWDTYKEWLKAPATFLQILAEVHGYSWEQEKVPGSGFTRWFITQGYALFHDNSGGSTPELGYLKL